MGRKSREKKEQRVRRSPARPDNSAIGFTGFVEKRGQDARAVLRLTTLILMLYHCPNDSTLLRAGLITGIVGTFNDILLFTFLKKASKLQTIMRGIRVFSLAGYVLCVGTCASRLCQMNLQGSEVFLLSTMTGHGINLKLLWLRFFKKAALEMTSPPIKERKIKNYHHIKIASLLLRSLGCVPLASHGSFGAIVMTLRLFSNLMGYLRSRMYLQRAGIEKNDVPNRGPTVNARRRWEFSAITCSPL